MTTSNSITPALAVTNKQKWRFSQPSARPYSVINTGFNKFDAAMKIGGWPLGTTTEIGVPMDGIGELRLLMPALRTLLTKVKPYIIWVAPPYVPYSRALIKEHIDPSQLIVVKAQDPQNALWSAEQILMANCCGALFTWTGRYNLSHKESRRLQLAAERSNTWHVQFRHSSCLKQPSAARLRLRLESGVHGQVVEIEKQPFGSKGQRFSLLLAPHYEQWQKVPAAYLPESNRPQPIHGINRPRKPQALTQLAGRKVLGKIREALQKS